MTTLRRWFVAVIAIAVCAAGLTALQYSPTLDYGFYYDDYLGLQIGDVGVR